MLNLKTMLYVVTVAQLGSFTKAAETLYISQSSISQAISTLERELNVKLFIRQNNKIYLTQMGELFVNEAEKLLERSELLEKRIAEISNENKTIVKLGLSSFYSKYYLPTLIPMLEKKLPNITFNFTEDISYNLEDMVCSDVLDFCMVPLPLAHNDLTAIKLKEERILLAVPPCHPLGEKGASEPVKLDVVKDEPFVFLKSFQRFNMLGVKLCKESGFSPNIVYESMNWETIDALVAQGIGVGLVPDVVTNVNNAKKPRYLQINSDLAHRTYALVYKSNFQKNYDLQSIITCIINGFRSFN